MASDTVVLEEEEISDGIASEDSENMLPLLEGDADDYDYEHEEDINQSDHLEEEGEGDEIEDLDTSDEFLYEETDDDDESRLSDIIEEADVETEQNPQLPLPPAIEAALDDVLSNIIRLTVEAAFSQTTVPLSNPPPPAAQTAQTRPAPPAPAPLHPIVAVLPSDYFVLRTNSRQGRAMPSIDAVLRQPNPNILDMFVDAVEIWDGRLLALRRH